MTANEKYNKLVYEIGKLKMGQLVNPQDFNLEYEEFEAIINEIEKDNLFNEG